MARRRKPKIVHITEELPLDESDLGEWGEVMPPEGGEAIPASGMLQPRNQWRPGSQGIFVLLMGLVFFTVLAAFILIPANSRLYPEAQEPPPPNCLGIHPELDWGVELHQLQCEPGVFEEGNDIAELLMEHHVNYKQVIPLLEAISRNKYASISPGDDYRFLVRPDDPLKPYVFAYAPDESSYILLNLRGKPAAYQHTRQVVNEKFQRADFVIRTSLAEAMFNREAGLKLSRELEDALKWKVDLFHLTPGDQFQMVYKERTYEGGISEIGKVQALKYRVSGEEKYAFWYEDDYIKGFYDYHGNAMRSGFLMAPLKFGRISSPFNPNRKDPVARDGRVIPHLGTDYAAPEGTPIQAVADGIVLKAEFKGGNGNYVKLLHTPEVQTQYLHMSRFAEGIAPGKEVRQGDVIGYVGSTGRSTGPHVCFRYWKNGEQVDHRKEKDIKVFPPLRGASLARFLEQRDQLLLEFDEMPI